MKARNYGFLRRNCPKSKGGATRIYERKHPVPQPAPAKVPR